MPLDCDYYRKVAGAYKSNPPERKTGYEDIRLFITAERDLRVVLKSAHSPTWELSTTSLRESRVGRLEKDFRASLQYPGAVDRRAYLTSGTRINRCCRSCE